MKNSEFIEYISKRFEEIQTLCKDKQTEYTTSGNAFSNFEGGKGISIVNTREGVAWEYMTKHLQSVKDIILELERGNIPLSAFKISEKTTDVILYMLLIETMILQKRKNGD